MHDFVRHIVSELKGSWRFRWIAMGAAWLFCVLGWLTVYAWPDSYESEATVYVDTSSALRPLLQQLTVDTDMLNRVEMVTTAMMGRPQLEKVAYETGLHLRAENSNAIDGLIAGMRKRLTLQNDPRRDPNVYKIGFRDESPAMAQSVVSSLLNIFVEDSLGANRVDSQKAQEFLRQELSDLEQDLTSSEQALAEFKKENVGRMPGESGDYFARLQREMDDLEDAQSSLRLANRRKEALLKQLSGEQPTLDSSSGPQTELDQRIAQNQTRLEELQLRFTDLHPDVIALKETLAQLKEQKTEQLKALREGNGTGVASDNPVFQNIQIELTNVNVEIAALEERIASQNRRIAELRNLIDVLPQVEAELQRLTRDYDVKQTQYQSLLQRLEMAELSESAERSDDVKFRIIEPPVVPEDPVAPNRPVLIALVLLAGLGAGGAVAFFANQVSPVYNDATTLREVTGMPVLGTVMIMRTTARRVRRVGQLTVYGGALLSLCVLFVVAVLIHDSASKAVQSLI